LEVNAAIVDENCRQRRPGGRTADVTRRINQAILELLAEGGIDACTFQNVAAKAGIERSTLYRRNPDRWPTIMGAIIDLAERETAIFETGSFRGDLASTLVNLVNILNGPLGPALMEVAAILQSGVSPGQTERFWESRRRRLASMFDAAISRGELPADVDRDELFSMAAGPIYFRKFIAALPIDESWVTTVVDLVCDRYCLKP
jgi:AcrR family transcriptional regulator